MFDATLITLPNGRQFPQYQGRALSWSIGSSFTIQDEQEGYPRTRAIIAAFRQHRPNELEYERIQLIKSSLADKVFGHNAKRLLALIEETNV